jgi:hypothetical protein
MGSKFENIYDESIRQKYGIKDGKLSTEPARRTIDLTQSPIAPSRHDARFLDSIKERYGISELAIVGGTVRKQGQTVEDYVLQKQAEAARAQGERLVATASREVNGKPMRLWLSISK